MDYRAISNLRTLQGKDSFRLWNERLINAFEQIAPGAESMFKQLIKAIDRKTDLVDLEDKWDSDVMELEVDDKQKDKLYWAKFGKNLNYVLQEKCEDAEAISKIRAAGGEGIKAYVSLYKWYLGSSGQQLTLKA